MPVPAIPTSPVNPFSTRFVRPDQTAYRFPEGEDAEAVAARLIERLLHRGAAAIIGPHGTGKSTLLHSLVPRLQQVFPEVERIQLSSATDALAELRACQRLPRPANASSSPAARCLVIDGFEQLRWVTRQRLIWQTMQWRSVPLRNDRRRPPRVCLLVTAHRAQFAVDTLYRTSWDDMIVRRLTEEKLCGLPRPERLRMLHAAEQQAVTMSPSEPRGRNVRDYWFALYDEYERLRSDRSRAFVPAASSGRRNAR